MTVPTWPTELPRPERSTWGAQQQDPRKQRRSETGPPGWSGRFSSAAKTVSLSIDISRDEKATFEKFHRETVRMGTLPFWMPDPTTHGWGLFTSSGSPLLISGGPNHGKPILVAARWLCSFGGQMPRETIRGVRFVFNFDVVVYP
nr:hypothetical protein [uncultured Shinella sp.]